MTTKRYHGSRARLVVVRHGMRVVCPNCAHLLDRIAGRQIGQENAYILLALLGLLVALIAVP